MTFENYLKIYTEYIHDVGKETYQKHPEETKMLFEFIDNWIGLIPKEEMFMETSNSLSGIILLNSWKLTNWISYEILNGKYFEAIRNLRFVFEGCVYAVIIEDAIESKTYEQWRTLSELSLKAEILKLWEVCKRAKVYRHRRVGIDKINRIVGDFVNQNIDPAKKLDAEQYIEVYTKILSNEKLYWSTTRMIEDCAKFLKIGESDVINLKQLWHELSNYLHFSHTYLEVFMKDPDFCFLEKPNDELLKRSLDFYFGTLDFFYAVLAWRFTKFHNKIGELCDWWKNNFNKSFSLTEKTLEITEE